MNLSMQFLLQVRQYAALESLKNIDYSEQIINRGEREIARLIADGSDPTLARDRVNGALSREVKRFPVQVPDPV